MAKSVTPGSFDLDDREIFANAVPDSFDARDLIYQPRLDLLPPEMDQRADRKSRYIYDQDGESCTGHAVASVINHVLDLRTERQRVSPYMLYRLARRYDTIPGDSDAGSSLRAAFKGWFNHGVALESEWPDLKPKREPDVDDDRLLRAWRARPLGAFYRVNPFRLDDVQSAITELKAIAVSGTIHDGWRRPIRVEKQVGRRTEVRYIIARSVSPQPLGGHAFCLVGYNETGLLVQNSWGTDWGKDGFATLPYEDWLDSA
ncbi:MAG TPA: C1 family peptidase, partial [Candidatus Limnocylindrales bacterium]